MQHTGDCCERGKSQESVWQSLVAFSRVEITRSRLIIEFAGNPVSALVLQVVAYHNLTVVQSAVESNAYSTIRLAWEMGSETSMSDLPKKLSHAAIANITGIDKETVRRSVKKLSEQIGL